MPQEVEATCGGQAGPGFDNSSCAWRAKNKTRGSDGGSTSFSKFVIHTELYNLYTYNYI